MARFRPGLELVKEGKCPVRATTDSSCWVCIFGHALECHYPDNCREANCSQYRAEVAIAKDKEALRHEQHSD